VGIDTVAEPGDKNLTSEVIPTGEVMKTDRKLWVALSLALSVIFAVPRWAASLEVGDKAPDFELESSKGGKLKLSSLRGKNVLINFYVLDFSPT
jgi:hypothetical protein